MHIYGDILLTTGFDDPVIDVEKITMEYPSVHNVFNSIKKIGANTLINSHGNNITKSMYKRIINLYPKTKKMMYPVTYEVIYGASWKKSKRRGKKSSNFIEIKKI
jgi:malonyl-CoA O-methyltransferase